VTNRGRLLLFGVGALGLAVLVLVAVLGLPHFGLDAGPYARLADAVAPAERHVTEAVGAVTFDIRAVDSLGEEAILFAAVAGVAIVLEPRGSEAESPAEERAEREGHGRVDTSETIALVALALLPCAALLGLSVIGHGLLTPGGGFQGGVIVSAALLLLFVGGDRNAFHHGLPEPPFEAFDGAGLGSYAVIGVVGLVGGVALFDNVFSFGQFGRLTSGGMMPLLSVAVGLEVTAGTTLVVRSFLDRLVRLSTRRRLGG
jgi:multicomponent Na+:H+ antiporter subunit B